MADQLARLGAGRPEAHPVDDVVEPALEQPQEVLASVALASLGLREIAAELALEHAVHALDLLLLAQLQAVVGRALTRGAAVLTGLGVELGLVADRAARVPCKGTREHGELAQAQRRGVLSREIEELRSALVVALSHVEAALDFSDEDIAFVLPADLTKLLTDLSSQLGRLLRSSEEGRICREGALVAIVGRPNVGKSSLMNALLRQERAIVTPVPGTTRDLLEEVVQIGGIPVRLVDTAGIRATQDPVETEGIKRSRLAWGDADLALILLDGSELLTDDDRAVLASPEAFGALLVVNKRDLPQRLTLEEVRSAYPACAGTVEISAKELAGLDHLRERVRDILTPHRLESAEGAMVTNLRHADALKRALEGIEQATQSVKQGRAGELVAMDLRIAADALGEITGVITTDEILQRIFAEFCIGK